MTHFPIMMSKSVICFSRSKGGTGKQYRDSTVSNGHLQPRANNCSRLIMPLWDNLRATIDQFIH